MMVECSTSSVGSMERPAQSERKRACPFADRGDEEPDNNNNSSSHSEASDGDDGGVIAEREAATRVRVVDAAGCDGRWENNRPCNSTTAMRSNTDMGC